jgi:hypothetical protein
MKFKNEFPKQETTIFTDKKNGSLTGILNATVHYRNYKGYLDKIDHYTISGNKNAWYGISSDFKYDYLMNKVKPFYLDSFKRKMIVTKI